MGEMENRMIHVQGKRNPYDGYERSLWLMEKPGIAQKGQ